MWFLSRSNHRVVLLPNLDQPNIIEHEPQYNCSTSNVTLVQVGNNATYLSCQNSVQWCYEADWTVLKISAACVCCQSVKLVWCRCCVELVLLVLLVLFMLAALAGAYDAFDVYHPQLGLVLPRIAKRSSGINVVCRPIQCLGQTPPECLRITSTDTQTSRHINFWNIFVQNVTQHKTQQEGL